MSKSSKGSAFEREICKKLSLWWSKGKRDDIFWRTAGSGARATVRHKRGNKTYGQYGDIQATDPIGQKLVDVFSIELKRGYSGTSVADLLDQLDASKPTAYEMFINQAEEDAKKAGTVTWLLIVKRNRRKALVFMSALSAFQLKHKGSAIRKSNPVFILNIHKRNGRIIKIFGTTLDNFLEQVEPLHIKRMHDMLVV